MRASLATQIRLHRRFFSLLHPRALEPSLPDLIFLFSTNYFSTPRRVCRIKKLLHTLQARTVWCGRWDLNPRTPTGQAPQACASKTLTVDGVSLPWLGNTSRPLAKADSRKHQARSRKNSVQDKALIGFRQSTNSIKTGQCL